MTLLPTMTCASRPSRMRPRTCDSLGPSSEAACFGVTNIGRSLRAVIAPPLQQSSAYLPINVIYPYKHALVRSRAAEQASQQNGLGLRVSVNPNNACTIFARIPEKESEGGRLEQLTGITAKARRLILIGDV